MSKFRIARYQIQMSNGVGLQQPFSAVLLSDLHNASYGDGNRVLLQAIRDEAPELIFVTGDMLISTQEPQMDVALALMEELAAQYPVYYVEGNHECKVRRYAKTDGLRYFDTLQDAGVHLLKNSCVRTELRNMPVTIWGLELPWRCYERFQKQELTAAQVGELLGESDRDRCNILLAHNPIYFEAYAEWGADLTLAGHLHGGAVRLPFLGGVITPQFQLFPKYDRGVFRLQDRQMVVSAGLGSHSTLLRINNPTELVVLDLI